MKPLVATVAVLVALATGAPVQAQTPDIDAQLSLGFKYEAGQVVPQDYAEAHMWFNLVAARETGERREFAVRERDRVADLMTPTQIAEAERLAHEWGHAHPREP